MSAVKGSVKAKSTLGALLIPTPFAWYAADDLNLSDGDPVTVWPDRGPNGLDAALATASAPTFHVDRTSSGLPAVDFVPTRVLRTNTFASRAQPNVIFIVWRTRANGRILDGENDASRHIVETSTTQVRIFAGTFLGYTREIVMPRFFIHTGIFNGPNSAIREDGQVVQTGPAGNQGTTRFTIGAHYNLASNPANAELAELIFYDRMLTDTEIEVVEAYLYRKYFYVQLSGTISGESDVQGVLSRHIKLSGSVEAELTVGADLSYVSEIWGTISAESTLEADLRRKIGLSVSIEGESTVEADLRRTVGLTGAVAGSSALEGGLRREVGLTASLPGLSTVGARLGRHAFIDGTVAALSELDAALSKGLMLSGKVDALSDLTSPLVLKFVIVGDVYALSHLSAALSGRFTLIGSVPAVSSLSAFIRVRGLFAAKLTGSVVRRIYLEGEVDLDG